MTRSIAAWSLHFRLLVLGIAAATVIAGFALLPTMALDVTPEFTPPYVEVQTEALGLSAEEVEQLITVPIEADLLNGVAFLDTIQSKSVAGLSSIVLTFEPGTDPVRARQVVAERMTQAHALPNVSKAPTMLQPLASASRVMMVGLSSDEVSMIDMSILAHWTVRQRLMGVTGVANVSVWGQRDRQIQVQVDPERLRDAGVTLENVIKTAGNALWVSPLSFLEASTPGTGGFVETPNQRLGVQHISPIVSADELAEVALDADGGAAQPIRLGDVANVVEDHQPLIGDALINDGEGLLLVIEKFPEANTLEVTRGIDQALAALAPGLSGIDIDSSIYRPASYIEAASGNLSLGLLIGLVLAALGLAALLLDWRSLLIVMVAIPVSLTVAGLVLYALGATINAMVVGGMALALVVIIDDAIVGVENVMRRVRQPRPDDEGRSKAEIVLEATVAGRGSLGYATLIIIAAAVPLLFLAGIAGAFLPPLAMAYALAIVASVFVSLTVSVALAVALLPERVGARHDGPAIRWLQSRFQPLLWRLVNRPRPMFLTAAVVTIGVAVLVAVSMVPGLGNTAVPTFRDGDLLVHWDGAPGTSRIEMNRIAAAASQELRAIDGVRNVGAHVGRAVASDQVVNINAGELWVSIDPDADYDATIAAIQETLDGYPGLRRELLSYQSDRINAILTDADDDVVVRVYGQELDVLRAQADSVRDELAGIDGVAAALVEPEILEPTVQIEVDLAAAESHGLSSGDIRRASTTLLSGIEVGSLFEDQKVFQVVVWGVPEIRESLTDISGLLIETPEGGHVRLDEVADVRVGPAATVVNREGVARRIDIGIDVAGRDAPSVVAEIEDRVQAMELPLEYHAEVRAIASDLQAEQLQMLAIVAAVVIVIFLLLQAAFDSWRLAATTLVVMPVALVGGALAAFVSGQSGSLGATVGFLAILAITARGSIRSIDHYQSLERADAEPSAREVIVRGTRERLGPILATALATALILLPFVALGDLPGFEIVRPMTIVILGGLVTATILNLFIIPTLYVHLGPSAEPAVATPTEPTPSPEPQVIGA
ncbi:MAG TPA: efflux RND transporter permease subunit [Candidatus Limnocylindria bacterium]